MRAVLATLARWQTMVVVGALTLAGTAVAVAVGGQGQPAARPVAVTSGGTVLATVDPVVQRAVDEALRDLPGGIVVLGLDGAVLAVTGVTGDPARDADGDQRLGVALGTAQPTGSTFKLVTALAAAEDAPGVEVDVRRVLEVDGRRAVWNADGGECGGDVANLLRLSCNTGIAELALQLELDRLTSLAADLGFGRRLLDEVPGAASEVPGWDAGATSFEVAQTAAGLRGAYATPLQMASVALVVANEGVRHEPYLDPDAASSPTRPSTPRRIVSAEAAGVVAEGMRDAVISGTAHGLGGLGLSVAAKTGTGSDDPDFNHAWVIGFAPAHTPEIAFAVFLEGSPERDDYAGGRQAAAVARAMLVTLVDEGLLQTVAR